MNPAHLDLPCVFSLRDSIVAAIEPLVAVPRCSCALVDACLLSVLLLGIFLPQSLCEAVVEQQRGNCVWMWVGMRRSGCVQEAYALSWDACMHACMISMFSCMPQQTKKLGHAAHTCRCVAAHVWVYFASGKEPVGCRCNSNGMASWPTVWCWCVAYSQLVCLVCCAVTSLHQFFCWRASCSGTCCQHCMPTVTSEQVSCVHSFASAELITACLWDLTAPRVTQQLIAVFFPHCFLGDMMLRGSFKKCQDCGPSAAACSRVGGPIATLPVGNPGGVRGGIASMERYGDCPAQDRSPVWCAGKTGARSIASVSSLIFTPVLVDV